MSALDIIHTILEALRKTIHKQIQREAIQEWEFTLLTIKMKYCCGHFTVDLHCYLYSQTSLDLIKHHIPQPSSVSSHKHGQILGTQSSRPQTKKQGQQGDTQLPGLIQLFQFVVKLSYWPYWHFSGNHPIMQQLGQDWVLLTLTNPEKAAQLMEV